MNPEPRTGMPEPFADTLEDLELQLERAQSLAQDSPNVFVKASINIAAVELFTALNRFDTTTLSKRLEEKPELYFQLLNAQFNMGRAHLDQQKFEFKKKQAEARQRERNQKLRARKPILITCRTLTSLANCLASSPRHEEPEADSINRTQENVVPASNLEHPASFSSVNSVPSVISVLKDNAPNQSSDSNDPKRRTPNAEPLVTANTGTSDFLDFKPAQYPPFRDESGTSEHPELETTDFQRLPRSVCCDVNTDELACCAG